MKFTADRNNRLKVNNSVAFTTVTKEDHHHHLVPNIPISPQEAPGFYLQDVLESGRGGPHQRTRSSWRAGRVLGGSIPSPVLVQSLTTHGEMSSLTKMLISSVSKVQAAPESTTWHPPWTTDPCHPGRPCCSPGPEERGHKQAHGIVRGWTVTETGRKMSRGQRNPLLLSSTLSTQGG